MRRASSICRNGYYGNESNLARYFYPWHLYSSHSSSLIGLLYVVLWLVLPKAETAADFLKMQGKPMNFDNLKNESNKLVQFANESTQRVGEIYNENKPYINNASSGIWNVFKYIVGGLLVLMAITSIIGVFVLFGLFGMDTDFPGPIRSDSIWMITDLIKYWQP